MVKRASPNLQISLVTQMRSIGINCPEVLGEHRKLFEELKEHAALRDYAQAALDVIEGRRYSIIFKVSFFCLSAMLKLLRSRVSLIFVFLSFPNIDVACITCVL